MLLSARDAAQLLGVKLDTLYAYVSRGLLQSLAVPESRERRYDAAAVERLLTVRREARRKPTAALTPVIGSAISLIDGHRFYYRGVDATGLADTATLEAAAALLWEGVPHPSPLPAGGEREGPAATRWEGEGRLGLIERCQIRLARLAAEDPVALDLSRAGVVRTGWAILDQVTACLGAEMPTRGPVHRRIAEHWQLGAGGADLVRRCLVLLADHELNASTFVARCVASTGATPYAVVSAALAALSGRRHGGATARAEALFREIIAGGDPTAVLAARLARNEELPGLGHPLYPEGDPRAAAILHAVGASLPEAWGRVEPIVASAGRLARQRPNVDFALAAAMAALAVPPGAALGLFVVGRTVGWIAHALEQYESGVLIRPRARYLGPRPEAQFGTATGSTA
jgi:citrate synthase